MGSDPASAAGSKPEDRNSPNTGTGIGSKASSLSGKKKKKCRAGEQVGLLLFYLFTVLTSTALQESFQVYSLQPEDNKSGKSPGGG